MLRPSRIFTALLYAAGGVSLVFSLALSAGPSSLPAQPMEEVFVERLLIGLFLLGTAMCWWVATLRVRGARSALQSSRTLSIFMLLFVPYGTVLGILWFAWVRKYDVLAFQSRGHAD